MALKAMILQATIVIDAWLVAGLGETALAGLGVAAALAGVALSAIFATSHAMQIRAAQAFGTGDAAFMRYTLLCGLAVAAVIAVAVAAILFAIGDAALRALAPTPETAALARDYLSIFLLVIAGEAVGQTLSSQFNGCGRTKILEFPRFRGRLRARGL